MAKAKSPSAKIAMQTQPVVTEPPAPAPAFAPGQDTPDAPLHQPMPVRGYQPQTPANVLLVNEGKAIEAAMIAYIGKLATVERVDKRMLAIGKTQLQGGCMWIYRSVFQPDET